MIGFEENEISKNASGGTEIAKRRLAELIDPKLLENFQIICSRQRTYEPDKLRVFWCHDLPEDPESNKFKDSEFQRNIHKYIFISNWQMQRYQLVQGVKYDGKVDVIESGIEPAPESCLEKTNDDGKIHIVYTSTPQRGLSILLPVFKYLAEHYPNIHLHVFSSFKIYGWDQMDAQFEPMYNEIRNHPQMTYHGFVPNAELKEFLNKCHIFAYPSIWLETSCRAMLEAMSAGLVCVHPNYGALPETSGALNIMYRGDMEDPQHHCNILVQHLDAAIRLVNSSSHKNLISFNKAYVDSRYNINRIVSQWEIMLKDLLHKYPTIESRQPKKEMLIYRTDRL
jgi:UDP-glucose:(glucosyl)LPS alpha-1,2-glucosyltransferase